LQLLTDISSSDITEPAREMTDRADDPLGVILLVVILGLGAPIVEEIFYRGLLQRSLVRRIGQPLGVGVSALVFAASHLQPLQFPALLLFGIVLGVLAERYGRLGPAIAAHMVFNLTAVVSLLVAGS
jgi:membrane protease YdiL (CAAX protease family)